MDDRRWEGDRRLGDRRIGNLPVPDEDRRSGEDRREAKERRGGSDRRRSKRKCAFLPDGKKPCNRLGVLRDPATKEWRCMEHLEVSPDTT